MKEKKQNQFLYDGLGFPIILLNVTMIKIMGAWTPKINYNKLQKAVLFALAHKPATLTGNELRFIRQYFELSMEEFGKILGVSHAAVSKWEKKGNENAHVDINTERFIRLFIVDKLKIGSVQFRKVYRKLALPPELKKECLEPFSLDVEKELLLSA